MAQEETRVPVWSAAALSVVALSCRSSEPYRVSVSRALASETPRPDHRFDWWGSDRPFIEDHRFKGASDALGETFSGVLDDVLLYNQGLSQPEIARLARGEVPPER
jgi:hypothetical protein